MVAKLATKRYEHATIALDTEARWRGTTQDMSLSFGSGLGLP